MGKQLNSEGDAAKSGPRSTALTGANTQDPAAGQSPSIAIAKKRKFNKMNPARRAFAVAAILKRDGNKCALCQEPFMEDGQQGPLSMTVDHIIPRAKGGSTRVDNLQLAHRKCNAEKRDHLTAPAAQMKPI